MNRKLKKFLIGLCLLVVLCPFTIIGFEALRHMRRNARFVHRYEEGVELLKQNQLAKAKQAFTECLQHDKHHQDAIVHLAEIAERQKEYRQAIRLWRNASRLEPASEHYKRRLLECSLLARDFAGALQLLQALPPAKRAEPEHEVQRIFCDMAQGHFLRALEAMQAFMETSPTYKSDLRTYLEITLELPEKRSLEEVRQAYEALLEGTSSLVVQYETLQALASVQLLTVPAGDEAARAAHTDEAVRLLKRAAELNPQCGHAALGAFLFQRNRWEECARSYEQAMPYGLMLRDTVYYGDTLLRLGRIDDLRALSQNFLRGSRTVLQVGYYLEALLAYNDRDAKTLVTRIRHTGNVSHFTRTGIMLNVIAALHDEALASLVHLASEIAYRPQLRGLLPVVRELSQGILEKAYHERRFSEAAPLAAILPALKRDTPDRLLLGLRLHATSATAASGEALFTEMLRLDPNDFEALEFGARFYLLHMQPDLAVSFAERALAQPAGVGATLGLNVVRNTALEARGHVDEAERHWRELQHSPEGGFVSAEYWLLFCLRHVQDKPGYMEEFLAAVATAEGPEKKLASIPALVAMRRQPPEEIRAQAVPAIDKLLKEKFLDPKRQPDAQVLFELALVLGAGGEVQKAIDLFLALHDTLPNSPLAAMNISELYAVQGDNENAMKYAREAYVANTDQPQVVFCYAKRLREQGKWAQLCQLVEPWETNAVYGEQARRFLDEALKAAELEKAAAEKEKPKKLERPDRPDRGQK